MFLFFLLLLLVVIKFKKFKNFIFKIGYYAQVYQTGLVHKSNRIYPWNTLSSPKVPELQSMAMVRAKAITFGEYKYLYAAQTLGKELRKLNIFHDVAVFSFSNIDKNFWAQHKHLLEEKKGAGYWLWKPYFCQKAFNELKMGDILLYIDGGLVLQSNGARDLAAYFKICQQSESGLVVFEQLYKQESWTKGDVFKELQMPMEKYGKLAQHLAGIIIIQKRETNVNLFNEWLEHATKPGLIDDSPSKSANHTEFITHRHDQSIFSLLAWKYKAYIDPAKSIYELKGRPANRYFAL
jgi:hypothetical protein